MFETLKGKEQAKADILFSAAINQTLNKKGQCKYDLRV